jgi:hypothetical protein
MSSSAWMEWPFPSSITRLVLANGEDLVDFVD